MVVCVVVERRVWLAERLAHTQHRRSTPPTHLPHNHVTPAGPPNPNAQYACTDPDAATKWPFCDTTLSHEARLDDLVKRINTTEMGVRVFIFILIFTSIGM